MAPEMNDTPPERDDQVKHLPSPGDRRRAQSRSQEVTDRAGLRAVLISTKSVLESTAWLLEREPGGWPRTVALLRGQVAEAEAALDGPGALARLHREREREAARAIAEAA